MANRDNYQMIARARDEPLHLITNASSYPWVFRIPHLRGLLQSYRGNKIDLMKTFKFYTSPTSTEDLFVIHHLTHRGPFTWKNAEDLLYVERHHLLLSGCKPPCSSDLAALLHAVWRAFGALCSWPFHYHFLCNLWIAKEVEPSNECSIATASVHALLQFALFR